MRFLPRFLTRSKIVLIAVFALALTGVWPGPAALPGAAQSPDDPDAWVSSLALEAHLQNLRTNNYTFWVGGDLGDPANAVGAPPVGQVVDGWDLPRLPGMEGVIPDPQTRPTLLNFWASWCPPCTMEFPHLAEIALAPDSHAFDVVFVDTSDTEADALAFLADYSPELAVVVDSSGRLSRRLSTGVLPTSVLIGADGTVLAAHVGVLTPTLTAFLDAVAIYPGQGRFDPLMAEGLKPTAKLLPVDPATATPIEYGQRLSGTLTQDEFQHAYRFEGKEGESVTVTMYADSSSLDAYVVLMTAGGVRLAENDYSVDSFVDASVQVTLPADDTYLVVATRFLEAEGFSSGDYSLLITVGGTGGDGILTYGSVVTGRVSGVNPRALYSFAGSAGDVVTLQVTHDPAGEPMSIEIKDPHLDRMMVSEESVDGVVALEDITLPEDGNYLVVVSRERSRDETYQDYTLTLQAEGQGGTPSPQLDGEGTLAYGQTVSGTLDNTNYEDLWLFEGQEGDIINLIMARELDDPGGLDGFLRLLGPDGTVLSEVDDAPMSGSVMPSLLDFRLPASGTYTVVATRFGFQTGFSTGAYSLTLEKVGTAPDTETDQTGGTDWLDESGLPVRVGRIAYNETVSGSLDRDHFEDWYLFRGRVGDQLSVEMNAGEIGDLDPFLILTDIGGRELASNDDCEAGSSAALIRDFALPADGLYLIRATRYGFGYGATSGTYTLVIKTEAAPLAPSDDGSPPVDLVYGQAAEGSLDLENVGDRFTFEGHTGDLVTISVRRTSGDVDPMLALRGPDGGQIEANDRWVTDAEARLVRRALPADGTYALDVLLENLNTSGGYRVLALASAPQQAAPLVEVTPSGDADLELVLSWLGTSDLDLSVMTPDGVVRDWSQLTGDSGGQLAETANDQCTDTTSVHTERMRWSSGSALAGLYEARVTYEFDCAGLGEPAIFTLTVVRGGVIVDVASGMITQAGQAYVVLFDYSPEGSP